MERKNKIIKKKKKSTELLFLILFGFFLLSKAELKMGNTLIKLYILNQNFKWGFYIVFRTL